MVTLWAMPCAGVRFKLLSVGDDDIRRALDAAFNAELLLDLCDAVEHVLKFLPVYHLITQDVHVCLDSAHARVKMVQARLNRVKSCMDYPDIRFRGRGLEAFVDHAGQVFEGDALVQMS
jgi:hypothetical protein